MWLKWFDLGKKYIIYCDELSDEDCIIFQMNLNKNKFVVTNKKLDVKIIE